MQKGINTLLILEEEREKDKSKFLSHQHIVKRWFDKHKGKEKNFEVGDLVLKWDRANEPKGNILKPFVEHSTHPKKVCDHFLFWVPLDLLH
jgi:hypothetical protein